MSRVHRGQLDASAGQRIRSSLAFALLFTGIWSTASAQGTPRTGSPDSAALTLFQRVRIFDGRSGTLSLPKNVLIRGNVIERISSEPIPVPRTTTTVVIDGGARTLMPGLIDAHWHTILVRPTTATLL